MWRCAWLAVAALIYSGRLEGFNNYNQQAPYNSHRAVCTGAVKNTLEQFHLLLKGNAHTLSNQPLGYYWLVYLVIGGAVMLQQAFVPSL